MRILDQLTRTVLLSRDHVPDSVTDEEICGRFQSCQVLCVSDLRNLSSHSGQTALVTLVSLLSRMGMQVSLGIPEVPMIFPHPRLSGTNLRQALIYASGRFIEGAAVRGEVNSEIADIVFALGDTRVERRHRRLWRLSGTEWSGALAMSQAANLWTAEWPIGAITSAALAASEAFKLVMRRLPMPESGRQFYEATKSCSWDFRSVPVPGTALDLGRVDIISAGAISQAALYTLAHIPDLRMRGRIFDDDVTEESNLNRNLLTLTADVDWPKVEVAARSCSPAFNLEPIQARFDRSNAGELAERVLVGVDDIPSRWEVQRHALGWLCVGGTSHFNASSSVHTPDQPCCGCLHWADDLTPVGAIPTVSIVSLWAGLAMAVRLLREALGYPYDPSRQHLWLSPLRMDQPHAAWWSPVAARTDCPVNCPASQRLRGRNAA